jgi:hypothetical protein
MPDLQPTAPTATLPLAADPVTRYGEDVYEFALGCECAEPALQIERWQQETAAVSAPAH